MENLGQILMPILITVITICICTMTSKIAKSAAETAPRKYQDIIYGLENIVSKAVITTNQTFVNELKKQGKFDKDAMKLAFDKTYESVIHSLSQSFYEYIEDENIDIDALLTQCIEQSVNWNRREYFINEPMPELKMEGEECDNECESISKTRDANE